MDLMEYKAKEIFTQHSIPTMRGIVVDDLTDLWLKVETLKYPLAVKAQVQTGGRGKAGGIKFADNLQELQAISQGMLGMSLKGHKVRKLLIEERLEVASEWYLSIILDRLTKGPLVIFSPVGGIDIEETARNFPAQVLRVPIDPLIGINDYLARYLLSKSGLEQTYLAQLSELLQQLYQVFCEYDCLLTEINPLVISTQGDLVALDGKITVDDSALFRQPEVLAFRDTLVEDPLILEARQYKFLYIPVEASGNIGVMSNGSGLIMSCIDQLANQGLKVGAALDLGGGATQERIKEAIRIVASTPHLDALFLNIFGGITRCDEVAAGVKLAVENYAIQKLIVVRIEGTNKEMGHRILSAINGTVVPVDSLGQGVGELVTRKGQYEYFNR